MSDDKNYAARVNTKGQRYLGIAEGCTGEAVTVETGVDFTVQGTTCHSCDPSYFHKVARPLDNEMTDHQRTALSLAGIPVPVECSIIPTQKLDLIQKQLAFLMGWQKWASDAMELPSVDWKAEPKPEDFGL